MRFGAYNDDNKIDCNYSIDDKLLEFIMSHRDLGVLVDSNLHLHDCVRNVVRKVGDLASELLYSTICRTSVFMVSLFVSYVRPIMAFCSNVWKVGYLGDSRLLESV